MTSNTENPAREFARTETGQFAFRVDQDTLPAWIALRTQGNLPVEEAAERMGVSRGHGNRLERRWKETNDLIAEYVQEPEPGKEYGYWVAYPNRTTITELVHQFDRASLAWGRGVTQEAALEDALHRGRRILDDNVRFPDVAVIPGGMKASWDYGKSLFSALVEHCGGVRGSGVRGSAGHRDDCWCRASQNRSGRTQRHDRGNDDSSPYPHGFLLHVALK